MTTMIACLKWVLDDADITVNPDLSINYARARYALSEYDKNAIEAAVQMAETANGKALGLAFAPDVPRQLVKDALSRRLDELLYVKAPEAAGANAQTTADALAAVIRGCENVGVIVCAEGSQDAFARQVPCRVAALLGMPLITSVSSYALEGTTFTATRRLGDRMQVVAVELPCVIAVLPEANTVPIPGMKMVLAAGKKPVTEQRLADLGVAVTASGPISQTGFVAQRKGVRIGGSPREMATQLKEYLVKEGVL